MYDLLKYFSFVFTLAFFHMAEAGYKSEADALLEWKFSLTNHDSLRSWANTSNLCSWYGMTCNKAGDLSEINLSNCSLQGALKNLTFSSFPNLVCLNFSSNALIGNIPAHIGTLSKVVHLDLSMNSFTGVLPVSLANLSILEELSLSYNHISGSIPSELGILKNLVVLSLRGNSLVGPIPLSLGNLSNLEALYLDQNHLSGFLPTNIGTLRNLVDLRVFSNRLTGVLSQEIGNLSSLSRLHLNDNNFSGSLPHEICQGRSLTYLTAANNHFTGPFPKSLKNCTTLFRVRLEGNLITGNLSQDIGLHPNLNYIDLSYNRIFGELSSNWGEFKDMTALLICCNAITGRIPKELSQLNKLQLLDLSGNHLVGEIPKELSLLEVLFNLNLSGNQLSGEAPHEIGMLTNLEFLDLSKNKLSGLIPEKISDCLRLQSLSFAENNFTGTIPFQIGNLVNLQDLLDLSQNFLTGGISPQFSKLIMLEKLNLSHNELTGSIPSSFSQMVSLLSVNFSDNELEGHLPSGNFFAQAPLDAFRNNKGLLREYDDLPQHNKVAKRNGHKGSVLVILVSMFGSLFVALLLFIAIFSFLHRRKPRNSENDRVQLTDDDIFSVWNYDGSIVFELIIDVTNDFSDVYCIGRGGSGKVYRAELSANHVLAVKRFSSEDGEEEINVQGTYMNEIKILTEVRHRNIVKLYGFCLHSRHSFLIYEYMQKGSLASVLSNEIDIAEFDWAKRLDVIKSVGNALSYLHHDCMPPIVHRDLSSNNILLNSEFEACVSDFGSAELLIPNTTTWASIAGTKGYMAPELAYSMVVTEKSDVYSFGVLTLEVIMGKHPRELMSVAPEIDVSSSSRYVLDSRLSPPDAHTAMNIQSAFVLALACLHSNPHSRPTMRQVSQNLTAM
ncbi:hypothetical protein ACHQM5_012014 [Ranunculus cassubicifolius]